MTLDTIKSDLIDLAPQIRRYCARMVGSVFDGDDLAQEAMATALAKHQLLLDGAEVKPWLYRIAHNKCIDHIRHTGKWQIEEATEQSLPAARDTAPLTQSRLAFEHLVITVPPRQRAMLLLKEVFNFSIHEIGSVMSCTEDAVKSGLSRARKSLSAEPQQGDTNMRTEDKQLMDLYAANFDAGDWDAVLALIHQEVQLDVATIYCGIGADKVINRYCTNYCKFDFPWRVNAVQLPSGGCALSWRMDGDQPQLIGATRFRFEQNKISHITDYLHDDAMLDLIREEMECSGIESFYPSAHHAIVRTAPRRI